MYGGNYFRSGSRILQLGHLTGFQNCVTRYNPQSNGLDERMNQTLNAALQKLVNESQDNWDNAQCPVCLPTLTKYTPFLWEARYPIDITQSNPKREDNTQEFTVDEKVEKMIKFRKQIMSKLEKMY